MVPGISNGEMKQQVIFLDQLRKKCGADIAIFLDWGRNDLGRKIALAQSTDRASDEMTDICHLVGKRRHIPGEAIIDIIAHSAGTIITNKTAIRLHDSGIRFRHVLFLGTPHDADADVSALMETSCSVLNVFSGNDKVNRTVSTDKGRIHAFTGESFRNLRMDTSLGGRKIRHYNFLENTPENLEQYAAVLATGSWPLAVPVSEQTSLTPAELYKAALWVRQVRVDKTERILVMRLIQNALKDSVPEIQTYGAIMAGLLADTVFRLRLMELLENKTSPGYLRREIYQALGSIGNPEDLRYLRRLRKSDPDSSDVLRDVMRDWKRKRIGGLPLPKS